MGERVRQPFTVLIEHLPGLGLLLVLGVPALVLQAHLTVSGKPVVSAVALVMVFGLVLRNLAGMPTSCLRGTRFAVTRLLRIGIVLLGAQLSLGEVLRSGGQSLLLIATCIILAILVVHRLSVWMGLSERLATLIGVGTSICGVSAVVATAPVIQAKEEETALAVGTIAAFGLLALFVYPLLGTALGLSDHVFGIWAGVAVNDTSQVVATGLMYSQHAAEIATVVKLTRNLFMAPVILVLNAAYMRRAASGGSGFASGGNRTYRNIVPVFVLGFLGMAVLNSLGILGLQARHLLRSLSGFLILLGIGGVGLGTDLAAVRRIGLKPFYAGLCAAVFMAAVSYTLIALVGIE